MVLILRILGWFGIVIAMFNAAIKLFADAEAVRRYAGADRNLDSNVSIIAVSLIFLALASILAEVRKQNSEL
ncbi:hypothetical protein [uncultured Pelagimonas sp.]|uniref:hypothetical protein n=1 Tax=uncultured Pelagimonas sp. TaxID=1618102 RepID=UPI002621E28E|nr:hypothetical protein [uncultured Pelagimonas sp.]